MAKKTAKKSASRAGARKSASRKTTTRKTTARKASTRGSGKRDTVDTGRTKMFAKRTGKGRFKEMDEVGRSLSTDRRTKAKTKTKSGYGDQGDRKR